MQGQHARMAVEELLVLVVLEQGQVRQLLRIGGHPRVLKEHLAGLALGVVALDELDQCGGGLAGHGMAENDVGRRRGRLCGLRKR